MTRNQEVAKILHEISTILELQGVPFKPRAYQRAALNIEALGEDVGAVAKAGRLAEIPGVGEAIAEKIREYLETGRLEYLEKIRKEVPSGLLEILRVPGVGPKTALRLLKELKVRGLADLETAAKAGKIRTLQGFGEKTEREILDGIARLRGAPARMPYPAALEVAEDLLKHLEGSGLVERAEAAGSLRRGRDTVGDVDLLVIAPPRAALKVVHRFESHRDVERVLESGTTRARVLLRGGLQVDLRIVAKESFGAALQYFTGSKEHNIALRTRALRRGWTINEYALARKRDGVRIAGASEEEIYAKLGLDWVPPEVRENQGEIEAAARRSLPRLVEAADLRGDLHTHTTESDGHSDAGDMLAEARRLGYAWFGVSDHSKGLGIARGLDGRRYAKQRIELDRLQRAAPKLRVLQGAEVNIRKDGTLDLEPKVLAALDYVIGSIHSAFGLPRGEQTKRILRALDAGLDVLAHPTTRLLGQRPEIEADWDAVFARAKARGVLLEVNASPFRLDLAGERVRAARAHGLGFVVNSDAHSTSGLGAARFGVTQARRGGLAAADVANTLPAAKLEKRLGHARP